MSKLSKINRKLKAAMEMFIKHEDVGALHSIIRLSKERRLALENLNNTESK